MKKLAVVLAIALATPALAAPPRVAVIRVADVFKQLDSTVKANEALKAKQAEINRDPRLATYNGMYADLQARRKALDTTPSELDPATRKRLDREYAIKLQEARSVFEDFEAFRTERTRELNTEMVAGMKERLAQIRATAEKLAQEEGYDLVFDASGNTNTGVPLLLYAKTTNDLTDRVLAALGKAGTPAPPPATPDNVAPAGSKPAAPAKPATGANR